MDNKDPTTAPPAPLFSNERIFISPDVMDSDSIGALCSSLGASLVTDPADATAAVLDLTPATPLPSSDSSRSLTAYFRRRSVRIFGPRCVRDSAEQKKPLPASATPVFNRAMEGVVLACDSELLAESGTVLRELVESMNGSFAGDQLPAGTTVLCGKSAMSQAYQVAVQRGIPVVRPAWVSGCFRSQCLLPTGGGEFVLPPMFGCVVCVTGLCSATRVYIQQMVVSLGGSFSPEFSRHCTHLVAASPSGPKYKASQLWRIPAVTADWITDSVNARACQPTASYLVHDPAHDASLSLLQQQAIAGGQQAHGYPIYLAAPTMAGSGSSRHGRSLRRVLGSMEASAVPLLRQRGPYGAWNAAGSGSSGHHHHRRSVVSTGTASHAVTSRTHPYDPRVCEIFVVPPQHAQGPPPPRLTERRQHTLLGRGAVPVLPPLQPPMLALPPIPSGAALAANGPAPCSAGCGERIEDAATRLQSALSQLFDACDLAISCLSTVPIDPRASAPSAAPQSQIQHSVQANPPAVPPTL